MTNDRGVNVNSSKDDNEKKRKKEKNPILLAAYTIKVYAVSYIFIDSGNKVII